MCPLDKHFRASGKYSNKPIMKNILNSRWYIMALTLAATFLVIGVNRLCMPVLFKEIAADLNLDLVAVGAVWGVDPLAGVFMSPPSGFIFDPFGV